MRQVDKFWKNMIVFFSSIVFLIVFSGCSSKNIQPLSSTQFYGQEQNITQDQLLNAVKKLFILSNKDKFIIETYRDKIHVIKPRISYILFNPIPQNDYFDFTVEKGDQNGSFVAKISISRKDILEDSNATYLDPNNFSHKLFWQRVNFLLQKNNIWPKCKYTTDNFLCDINDRENTHVSVTKADVVKAQKPMKPKVIKYKMINLNDINYKNKENNDKNEPQQNISFSSKIKGQKRGTHDDSITEKTLKLKNVDIEDRKPAKTPIKSPDEKSVKKQQ